MVADIVMRLLEKMFYLFFLIFLSAAKEFRLCDQLTWIEGRAAKNCADAENTW